MHAFCWYLGLQYRAHHAEFGWAFQWHERAGSTPSQRPPRRGPGVPQPPLDTPEARRARMRGEPVPQRALPVPPSQQQ
jgi:hypothetical protein